MKLPKKIKIAGYVYKVDEWNSKDATETERYGECCKQTKKIRIDTSYGRNK